MGQQQLLLLVLSTVIVGLATVAGIQAFQQGQSQAANDALTQKAVQIASDIQAQAKKPDQLGGIDPTSDGATAVANAIGYNKTSGIEAPGAGSNADCSIASANSQIEVTCSGGNASTAVTAAVDSSNGGEEIVTTFSSN